MLHVQDLWKSYQVGESRIEVLSGLDLEVSAGEFVSVVGASGTGKSTLLHLLGALDRPDRGEITVDGDPTIEDNEKKIASLRNRRIGFVFQFHHLLPEFTALENTALPARILGRSEAEASRLAETKLQEVDLAERLGHLPNQLSGGERQRVAVARSLVNKPSLLLMDEPTGNLDPKSASALFDLVRSLQRKDGLTIVMATHNMELARQTDRCLRLQNGKLVPYGD